MLVKGPDLQNCGTLTFEIGEPVSFLSFKKEDSIAAFNFVWLKTSGGYSNPQDFIIYLNGIILNNKVTAENFFFENIDLIRNDNKFEVEILNSDSYQYFRSIFVYPIIAGYGKDEWGLKELKNW